MRFAVSLIICSMLVSSSFAQQNGTRKTAHGIRADELVRIDGILSESVWQGPGITDFTQVDPVEGAPVSERTETWVAYDDAAVYVAARLYDSSPDSITRTVTRRDSFIPTDLFTVMFDTYYDRQTGFFFSLTPAGTQHDGTYENDNWTDRTWEGVWEGVARIDETGWTVEMRIPYSQLRFPKKDEYTWGVNFRRIINRKNETAMYSRTPKGESGGVSRFADLTGIRDINPPARLEIVPYVVASGKYIKQAAGDPFNTGKDYFGNAGADMKIGLGSNLTLDATINPDFGQVEVDPAVVNLSAYETFYQEKRPFFVEGASIFSFGQGGANSFWSFNWSRPDFFYSRRIGRRPQGFPQHQGYADIPDGTTILGAAKLSGKIGESWSVGFLNAVTEREYAQVDSSGVRFQDEVEPLTYYGVLRTRKEFNEGRQAVGFLTTATVRDARNPLLSRIMNDQAFAFGTDGWTFLDSAKVWVVTGWVAGTYVTGAPEQMLRLQRSSARYYQRPDANHLEVDSSATSLAGWVSRWTLNKQQGNLIVNLAIGAVSPGVESNDLGFSTRTDNINMHAVVGYRWYQPDGTFRSKSVQVATYRGYDFSGENVDAGYFLFGGGQFMNFWGLNFNVSNRPRTVNTRLTRGGPMMLNLGSSGANFFGYTDERKEISFYGGAFGSSSVDGSWYYSFWAEMGWRPSPQLTVTLGPSWDRTLIDAQYIRQVTDPSAVQTFGSRYVFASLTQSTLSANVRLDWTFTPKLTLQMYLQPFFAVGSYARFKELSRQKSYDFSVYGEGSSSITFQNGVYTVDPDGSGPAGSFNIANPDFNFKSLRGTAVLRWEYLPGSTFYLVWTQDRADFRNPGRMRVRRDVSDLFSSHPNNIFLVKISYWLNP
jgi:hypothetical protein